ncbi:endonuclease/exonuclease/phosphatase family protein [Thiomicrospira sp.]|uniref:endonuclease/exonuclease/phosphatase family protein n=1 Tax=Thiomicrospira sp. TaxID=935 RepID=UPI002F93A046
MKIFNWNCNGALRKKLDIVKRVNADLWIGGNKNKGILVASRSRHELISLEWNNPDGLQLFLPFVYRGIVFVAVWTKQANSPNFRYIGQLWKYIRLHKVVFSRFKPIIIGDFNSNVIWDEWDRWWNHSDLERILEEMGIKSLYHSKFNEMSGSETQPTFFLHRKHDRPYHIDYCFMPTRNHSNSNIKIGDRKEWLEYSDHLPLIIDSEGLEK